MGGVGRESASGAPAWSGRGSRSSWREALFRCARPSGVPRGPATATGSLASQRHPGKFPKVPGRRRASCSYPGVNARSWEGTWTVQGRGERGRRGAGVGFWRGWGHRIKLYNQQYLVTKRWAVSVSRITSAIHIVVGVNLLLVFLIWPLVRLPSSVPLGGCL